VHQHNAGEDEHEPVYYYQLAGSSAEKKAYNPPEHRHIITTYRSYLCESSAEHHQFMEKA